MRKSLRIEILALANRKQASFAEVLADGWTYTQVLDEVARLQLAGLLERREGLIYLTDAGRSALEERKRTKLPRARREVRLEDEPGVGVYLPKVTSLQAIEDAISTAGESRGGVDSTS